MTHIIKHNGEQQAFSREKVETCYGNIAKELIQHCSFETFKQELNRYVTPGMSTKDLMHMMIKTAINLISIENSSRQSIAGRFATIDLRKQAGRNRGIAFDNIYNPQSYLDLVKDYIAKGHYYKDFFSYYSEAEIMEAGKAINKEQDFEYIYTTVMMLRKRYLLNPNKIIHELPQEMYMSIALFLAIPEPKKLRLQRAIEIYQACSSQEISLPTPTLLNARTNFCQLSSCFKLNIDDDLRSIYHNIENMAQISKFGGGIGTYLGHIRSKGADIRGVHGASGGILPWIKVINDTAIAVNQLGARAGAISVTNDIRHRDIMDFLDMQTETGDIRRKSFDIFPAVSIPDIFMRRVIENGNRTLFDPKEVREITGKKLENHIGEEFETLYEDLEKRTDLRLKETVPAKELFKKLLKTVVETGMPYIFFRDTVNKLNPNKHAGTIYSTQLCTEICQNTTAAEFKEETADTDGNISIRYTPGESVVCNLASINVAKVYTPEKIKQIIPIAMRILDNVITLNYYPIKEAELTAMKYRSVGLGFLGLAEHLATNHMMYDGGFSRDYVDKLFEQYAFSTLQASTDLAQERGAYPLFPGSDWSKGILFGRDEERYANHSTLKGERTELIKTIKEKGIRFAYHLSPAPNTSTSLVVGTTAGLLPIYKKYFVETNSVAPSVNVAPNLTPQNTRFYKEYVHMNMPDVIDMIATIQKRIDQSISFEWMINPANVTPAELYSYYLKARQQGIKTVYYVRSMSLDVKECSSCSG